MENKLLHRISVLHIQSLVMAIGAFFCLFYYWGGEDGNWRGSKVSRGSDLVQHYIAGQIVREGDAAKLYHDSYLLKRQLGIEEAPFHFNYVYGPLVARIAAWGMRIDFQSFYKGWLVLSVLCAWVAARLLDSSGITVKHAGLVIVGFPPFLYCLVFGQVTPLSLVIICLSALFIKNNKMFEAGIVFSFLFYKPQIVPFVCLAMLLMRWWKFVGGIVFGGIFWALLTLWVGGWGEFKDWLVVIGGMAEGGAQSQNYFLNITYDGLFRGYGLSLGLKLAISIVAVCMAGLLLRKAPVSKVWTLFLVVTFCLPFLPYASCYELLVTVPVMLVMYQIQKNYWDVILVSIWWLTSLASFCFTSVNIAILAPVMTLCCVWLIWKFRFYKAEDHRQAAPFANP